MSGYVAIILLSVSAAVVEAPLPLVPIGIGAASVLGASYLKLRCYLRHVECCDEYWIPDDISGLTKSLRERLYGQHLATDIVLKNLQGHVRSTNPESKALVLSFHGWTGSGKNFLSKMVAGHMYRLGTNSRYVHFLSATLHFPHAKQVDAYKNYIHQLVKSSVSECGRSLFIFDEVEKMPAGLLSSLKPYVDNHDQVDGVDYRKAIFIFISNAGGETINRIVLEWWRNGRTREHIQLNDIESELEVQTYNADGGLKGSSLIELSLVSAFVPFLPLERSHVRLCVRDNLLAKNRTAEEDVINKVLEELKFFPEDVQLFSKRGCRPVSDKVNLIVEELGGT